jgi:hypothetical protein
MQRKERNDDLLINRVTGTFILVVVEGAALLFIATVTVNQYISTKGIFGICEQDREGHS